MSIYLTLDYELFMGNYVGSVDRCLIKPTEKLMSILKQHNVKATFFVDASYLYVLNQKKSSSIKLQKDFESIANQLLQIKKEGHTIQLHIHPQWFFAEFDGFTWILDDKYYKLSDLPQNIVPRLFLETKIFLESLIKDDVSAFRAGGYSIQSYKEIADLFSLADIVVDSSVLPGKFCINGVQYYDFRKVHSCDSYNFSEEITKPETDGRFHEIPISTGRLNYWQYYKNYISFKLSRYNKGLYGDGKPVNNRVRRGGRIQLNKIFSVNKNQIVASIDTGLITFLKALFKKRDSSNEFVIIGHPKNLSEYSFRILEKFLNYTVKHDYKTIGGE